MRQKGNVKFAILDIYDRLYADQSLALTDKEQEKLIKAAGSEEKEVELLQKGLFSNSIAVIMKAQTYGLKMIGMKSLDEITDMALSLLAAFGIAVVVLLGEVAVLSRRVAESGYFKEKADRTLKGVLSLFHEDGSASCAMVYPMSVNGVRAGFYDAWANDQDWGLYFALKYGETI